MKIKSSAFIAITTAVFSTSTLAGVFNDAYFLLYGGVDNNGNGCIDAGDVVDYRHYGDSSADTGKFSIRWGGNFSTAEKQQAFSIGNESVRLATANITLENEPCIRWHQYVYTGDGVQKVKYSTLQSASGILPDSDKFTFLMRFRPTFFGGAGTAPTILYFANTWGKTGMRVYAKLNSASTGGYIRIGMGKSGIDTDVPSLVVTNGVWHEMALVLDGTNRKMAIGLNQELGYDWRGPSYGQGYMLWYEVAIPESITGWSFNPTDANSTEQYIRLFGDAPETSGVAVSSATTLGGDIHMVGMWSRALSRKEIYEALGNRRPAVFEIGDKDARADAFFKGEIGKDATIDSIPRCWHDFPSALQRGSSATIRFTVPDNYAGLPQVLCLKADVGSCMGIVTTTIDGEMSLGEQVVKAGGVSRFYITKDVLAAGSHSITLQRTDDGTGNLSFCAVSLSGSWQVGAADSSRIDFNAPNNATDFYFSDGNVHDYAYELKNEKGGGRRDFVFHFDLPEEGVDMHKYRFETKLLGYDRRYPTLAYYSVNNSAWREFVNLATESLDKPTLAIDIPSAELMPGQENTIRISNVVDNGDTPSYSGYLTFDYYRFVTTKRNGFVLSFR